LKINTKPVQKWERIISSTDQSVAVHVRLGDFMTGKHRLVNSSFYLDAMALIADRLQAKNQTEPTFFIFSDDMNSVMNEFSIETVVNERGVAAGAYELIVVGGRNFSVHLVSTSHNTMLNIEEFYLMTKCNHNIISESSFGWWASYLNPHEDKIVIAAHYSPKMFNRDPYHQFQYRYFYYPLNWTVVDASFVN
jgi:hypothetical protein